ncbi:Replicase family protein [Caballeronia udeis]|uniref:Replicase family protein n=1 Tax=Caballeronia udeis TaxID=1232866 RepID=A0A158H5N6_9BURK|nr:replication initiation protein [Caballeronia udeis]SAL39648.1 Replicase family protein [Caballeronia udeis]
MNQQLEEFFTHLNEAVVTTNDFTEGTRFRKREKVDQFAYCGLNQMYRSYLSFDLDTPGSAFRFEDANVPPPTIVTINPENAHCHMLYRLNTPVICTKHGRSAPQDFFDAIQDEMEVRLQADQAFNHTLTKNPRHPRWKVMTYPVSYDLSDFLEYIDLPRRSSRIVLPDHIQPRGRNDELFHGLRIWSYGAVHTVTDEDQWQAVAFAKATEINACFACPLPFAEVKATAKSVARWVWKEQHKLGKTRPKVLTFADETAGQRMSKGAEYTNAVRREKSLQTLRQAVADLQRIYGNKISVSMLVANTRMNIKTVRKYFPEVMKAAS